MGRQSSTLQGKHGQSLFIGKPVQYKSNMARMGMLRFGDLRCASATFMVVVFFCCVFMLSLQPSTYTAKMTMVDLPKDEVVRAQSIASLAHTTSKNTKQSGSGKEGKKISKSEQKKLDKKAIKAKWIKDELPKKLHTGHVHNNTKSLAKLNKSEELTNKNLILNGQVQNKTTLTKLNGGLEMTNTNSTDVKPSGGTPKDVDVAIHASGTPKQTESRSRDVVHNTRPQPPKPSMEVSRAEPSQVPPRPTTNFSDLNKVPLKAFRSPFIESKTKGEYLQADDNLKLVAWYKPEQTRDLNRKRKVLESCPQVQCKLVYPLYPGQRVDAIVFDGVDRHSAPPVRIDDDQVFVFHEMKPPPFPQQGLWPDAWNSVFNWTWTYRHDSDICQPHGLLKKAKKVKPLDYFDSLTKTKTRALAWFPHTCPSTTSSKRNEYIQELSKHVRISEFGPCSNKSCAKSDASCSENLTKKFFFVLAIEDNMCKDHVTEVFYRAWQEKTHVVPIVRGGTDYATYFPEGTYIDADWFDSAKHLSEFLAELMASRKTYSQLLWRRAHWVRAVKPVGELSLCKLCYKLHSLSSNRQQYPDIQGWYEKGVCKSPKPF